MTDAYSAIAATPQWPGFMPVKESRQRPWNYAKTSTEALSVVVEREIPYPPEKIWRARSYNRT
jgi:hypothetical protein